MVPLPLAWKEGVPTRLGVRLLGGIAEGVGVLVVAVGGAAAEGCAEG